MEVDARRAVAWAAAAWGHEVERVRPMAGGWTSTMLELTSVSGKRAVLRLMTKEPWRSHAVQLLRREADIQDLLAATSVQAPTSLALDETGRQASLPAHLMSHLPGSVDLARSDAAALRSAARLLASIHEVDPGPARPREYQSWAVASKRVVPEWSRRPELWRQAFDLLDRPAPAHRGVFLHRDFHLGNILWSGGEVSGVVDWVETSWGPRSLDVAHAGTYLAMLHGPETGARFADLYWGSRGVGADDGPYWDVMDVVGYLPDPVKVVQPWRDLGVRISDDQARSRLEQHLAAVLARHSGSGWLRPR